MSDESTPATPPPVPVPPSLTTPEVRTAPSAVWSLILGFLSPCCFAFMTAIPAIICGHIARSAIRKSGGTLGGGGMALGGLILGYLSLLLYLIIIPALVIPLIIKEQRNLHERAARTMEMVSSDGRTRVSVPGDWVDLPGLNNDATLQIGNKEEDKYLLILSEARSRLPGMTLEKHHQLTRDGMLKKMQDSSATDPVSLTIDGNKALQDEIRGNRDGAMIIFLHTTVDDGDYFHQILTWTVKSRWEKNKAELRKITETFRGKK